MNRSAEKAMTTGVQIQYQNSSLAGAKRDITGYHIVRRRLGEEHMGWKLSRSGTDLRLGGNDSVNLNHVTRFRTSKDVNRTDSEHDFLHGYCISQPTSNQQYHPLEPNLVMREVAATSSVHDHQVVGRSSEGCSVPLTLLQSFKNCMRSTFLHDGPGKRH